MSVPIVMDQSDKEKTGPGQDNAANIVAIGHKEEWIDYRTGINTVDDKPTTLTTPVACAEAHHNSAELIDTPRCNSNRLHIRVLGNATAKAHTMYLVTWNSKGSEMGTRLASFILTTTDGTDSAQYVSGVKIVDVGPDDQFHVFCSSLGGTTALDIQYRRD